MSLLAFLMHSPAVSPARQRLRRNMVREGLPGRSAPDGRVQLPLPWSWGAKIGEQLIIDALASVKQLFTGRVLDLGCGMRPYERLLGRSVDSWVGLDQRTTYSGPPKADVYGSALRLPFGACTFDNILSTQVLEHVVEPVELLREAHRVLRSDGYLVLTAPQTNPLHEEPYDYFRYTCYGIRALAERVGFEVVEVRALGGVIATIGQLLVWHMSWLRRLPIAGRMLGNVVNATVAWGALRLDRISHIYGGGAMKDTLNWLLVARKLQRC